MSNLNTTNTGLAGIFGRSFQKLRAPFAVSEIAEPHGSAPLNRDDLAELFNMNEEEIIPQPEELRESELLEQENMSLIRGALYKSD